MSTASNLNELVIDRRTWLRGSKHNSVLRNGAGKMCCLGFRALQCGYTEQEIMLHGTPVNVIADNSSVPKDGFASLITVNLNDQRIDNSQFATDAMGINDNESYNDIVREQNLTTLFQKHGIAIKFEN